MFLGRYRRVNKDTLIIQKRSIGFLTVIPFIVFSIVDSVLCLLTGKKRWLQEWLWEDWTEYNNILYQKDEELNRHAKKMEELIAERKLDADLISDESKSLEKDEYATRGYSLPSLFDASKLGPIGLNFVKPEQKWKKLLNPKVYGKGKRTASGKDRGYRENNSGGGSTTAYTLSDYSNYNVAMEEAAYEIGADQLITYREDNNKSNKGNKGGGGRNNQPNPQNRKRQKGETPEGHQERLDALQANEDVSDWEFR